MNRRDQAKLRKKYQRGRYARFEGSTLVHIRKTTKIIERIEPVATPDDPKALDHVKVKRVEVFVGRPHLGKNVVNTGSSVNTERMEQYFDRVKSLAGPRTLREDLGIKDPRYKQVWLETPVTNRLNIANTPSGRMDMYWHGGVYFLVDLDYVTKTIRRSRDYGHPDRIKQAIRLRRVTWEWQIPMK